MCTTRIEELSKELASLEGRRSNLIEEISGSKPELPDPKELTDLREDVERSLMAEEFPQRKAAMQAVVAEIKVRNRAHIPSLPRTNISTTVWIGTPGRTRTCAPGSGGQCSIR